MYILDTKKPLRMATAGLYNSRTVAILPPPVGAGGVDSQQQVGSFVEVRLFPLVGAVFHMARSFPLQAKFFRLGRFPTAGRVTLVGEPLLSTPPPMRPGPNAGEMSPETAALRGPMPLTADQRRQAKELRQDGWDWPAIAAVIKRSEADIRHALANARTPLSNPKRGTANISLAALAHINARKLPGEAVWETVNRLLGV